MSARELRYLARGRGLMGSYWEGRGSLWEQHVRHCLRKGLKGDIQMARARMRAKAATTGVVTGVFLGMARITVFQRCFVRLFLPLSECMRCSAGLCV